MIPAIERATALPILEGRRTGRGLSVWPKDIYDRLLLAGHLVPVEQVEFPVRVLRPGVFRLRAVLVRSRNALKRKDIVIIDNGKDYGR